MRRGISSWSGRVKDRTEAGDGVFGRVFTVAGTPMSGEFQVNSFTAGPQSRPAVSADGAGNFVVVWQSEGQDGGGPGIYGRRFSPTGASVGDEFQINMFTLQRSAKSFRVLERQRVFRRRLAKRVAGRKR